MLTVTSQIHIYYNTSEEVRVVKWEWTAMTFTFGTEQVYQTFCDLNPMLRERGEDE